MRTSKSCDSAVGPWAADTRLKRYSQASGFRVLRRGSANPPPSGGRKVREMDQWRSDVRTRMVRFRMVLGAEQREAKGYGSSGWPSTRNVGRMADDHRLEPYPGNPRLQEKVCSSGGRSLFCPKR